ncbi:MAG: tRNA (adenosine(37)-N6)-dimethylallyltransferase MiaA [Candidatus Saccharimonadales bacterium]
MASFPNSELRTPNLLVIIGETASGKTSLAIDVAKRLNGEIICADSSTVRRGANIGSAKPTEKEQQGVPHHLLSIIGPDEKYSAADFQQQANMLIQDIAGRGKLPIIAGGTGLYIDSMLYDYEFRDEADPEERDRLNTLTLGELLSEIKQQGIELGETDTKNKHRLIRLLETGGQQVAHKPLRENTFIIGIQLDRELLRARIEQRVDAMLEQGLEREVKALSGQYGWNCEALKGVGYAQWQDYFLSTQTLAETHQKIIKATMDLAKRQRTWFKRNKSIHWLNYPINREEVVDLVTTSLDK